MSDTPRVTDMWWTIIDHGLGGGPLGKFGSKEDAQAQVDTWDHGGQVAVTQEIQTPQGVRYVTSPGSQQT